MVSPETAEILAELGVGMLIIPQKPWDEIARDLETYSAACRRLGREPLPPVAACWVYCDADARAAEEEARRWIGSYWRSAMAHYEIGGAHFKNLKGYEYYGQLTDVMESAGPAIIEQITEAFVATQVWGTPEQCLEKIRDIEQRIRNDHLVGVFSFGGMPYDRAERSMRLFAAEVMPHLQERPGALASPRRRRRSAS
jgi:alkanesulfonate monooxygenase SsuD/methylene tetrahydromethanopterin reductase-like flavin-dependent oxidoreductase (luciferase family)